MFGLSFTKILFTIAVVVGVWWLFRSLARRKDQKDRRAEIEKAAQDAVRETLRRQGREPQAVDPEDLVACSACGAYGAKGSRCGCGAMIK